MFTKIMNRSTLSQLFLSYTKVLDSFDNKHRSLWIIFLDFSKVFDNIPHNRVDILAIYDRYHWSIMVVLWRLLEKQTTLCRIRWVQIIRAASCPLWSSSGECPWFLTFSDICQWYSFCVYSFSSVFMFADGTKLASSIKINFSECGDAEKF